MAGANTDGDGEKRVKKELVTFLFDNQTMTLRVKEDVSRLKNVDVKDTRFGDVVSIIC